jgi:hypothetical protein
MCCERHWAPGSTSVRCTGSVRAALRREPWTTPGLSSTSCARPIHEAGATVHELDSLRAAKGLAEPHLLRSSLLFSTAFSSTRIPPTPSLAPDVFDVYSFRHLAQLHLAVGRPVIDLFPCISTRCTGMMHPTLLADSPLYHQASPCASLMRNAGKQGPPWRRTKSLQRTLVREAIMSAARSCRQSEPQPGGAYHCCAGDRSLL